MLLLHRSHAIVQLSIIGVRVRHKIAVFKLVQSVCSCVLVVDLVNLFTNVRAGDITTKVQSPGKLKDSFITTTKTLQDL